MEPGVINFNLKQGCTLNEPITCYQTDGLEGGVLPSALLDAGGGKTITVKGAIEGTTENGILVGCSPADKSKPSVVLDAGGDRTITITGAIYGTTEHAVAVGLTPNPGVLPYADLTIAAKLLRVQGVIKGTTEHAIDVAIGVNTPKKPSVALAVDTKILTVEGAIEGTDEHTVLVSVEANSSDALSVTKNDGTMTIAIKLANATASKNTDALIEAAIQALATVGTIDVSEWTATGNAEWIASPPIAGTVSATALSGGDTGDTLVVTADGAHIAIMLADASPSKNTPEAIQEKIRDLGTVSGIDVSEWTTEANAAWCYSAPITGSVDATALSHGYTSVLNVEKNSTLNAILIGLSETPGENTAASIQTAIRNLNHINGISLTAWVVETDADWIADPPTDVTVAGQNLSGGVAPTLAIDMRIGAKELTIRLSGTSDDNCAWNIQQAIRALGNLGAIDLSGWTVIASDDWDDAPPTDATIASVALASGAEGTRTLVDFTGKTARMVIRRGTRGEVLSTLTTENGGLTLNAGQIIPAITADESALLTACLGKHDLFVITGEVVEHWFTGDFVITAG